ncbi:MAG: rod shape-determining protein MreC [Paramuribaculum sp.]|nr:rod shape-determining protein MreC [Paramuribaculum sp.]
MRNLILFFIRYSSVFLLVIYITIGILLLVENNPYQRHLYLTSANSVSASVYKTANNVSGYFHLKNINEELAYRNTELESEVLDLRQRLRDLSATEDSLAPFDANPSRYNFTLAHVINNSTRHRNNYITIDKGALDGIEPEMGVIDHNGIIGIVEIVGPRASRIISLLNDQFRLSCKVKGYDFVGSLVWDGKNPTEAILEELPRHSTFNKGDTVITSGYSTVFPEGILVGTVLDGLKDYDENFYALKVKLFTNHEALSTVTVVKDNLREELKKLDAQDTDENNQTRKKK